MKTSKARIYIDTCCIIQHVKGAIEEKDGFSKRDLDYIQMILKAAQKGDVELVTSSVTVTECLHTGDSKNIPEDTKRLFNSILTSGRIIILKHPDLFVVERARDFCWEDGIGIKPIDSIHLASAIETGCKEFWTGDRLGGSEGNKRNLLFENYGIKVILPSESKLIPSDYKQMGMFEKEKKAQKKVRRPKKSIKKKENSLISKVAVEARDQIKDLVQTKANPPKV